MPIDKKFWISAAVILLIIIAIAVYSRQTTKVDQSQNPQNQEKTTVRIAQLLVQFTTVFPIFVGQETGIFDEHGLDIKTEQMSSNTGVPALLANEVDYILFSQKTAAAALKEAPIRMIATVSENPFLYLVGQPNLGLSQIKTIGITSKHSYTHYLALKAIEKHNLSAELVVTGNNPLTARALLTQGKIDAAIVGVPDVFQFRKDGFQVYEMIDAETTNTISTRLDEIENNPETVRKVVQALRAIGAFIKNNPKETKDLLFKFFEMEKNEANQQAVDETYVAAKQYFSDTGIPGQEGLAQLIKLAKVGQFETIEEIEQQGVTAEDIEQVFDFRFLR